MKITKSPFSENCAHFFQTIGGPRPPKDPLLRTSCGCLSNFIKSASVSCIFETKRPFNHHIEKKIRKETTGMHIMSIIISHSMWVSLLLLASYTSPERKQLCNSLGQGRRWPLKFSEDTRIFPSNSVNFCPIFKFFFLAESLFKSSPHFIVHFYILCSQFILFY